MGLGQRVRESRFRMLTPDNIQNISWSIKGFMSWGSGISEAGIRDFRRKRGRGRGRGV